MQFIPYNFRANFRPFNDVKESFDSNIMIRRLNIKHRYRFPIPSRQFCRKSKVGNTKIHYDRVNQDY